MSGETQIREGGCHCGAVRFEAELPAELKAARCNCSICAMKGVAMIYVPLDAVRVTKGEDKLACYRFNTKEAKHFFCPECGIHLFHHARKDPSRCAVSAATIDGVRVYEDFLRLRVFDGVNHSLDHGGVQHMAGTLIFEKSDE